MAAPNVNPNLKTTPGLNTFILSPAALKNFPRFEDMLDCFKSFGVGFEFGFNTDFTMPGHGKKVNDELFKKGRWGMALPVTGNGKKTTLKGPHFSLALTREIETKNKGKEETYESCLIATWVHDKKNYPTPTVFVTISNADVKSTVLLFSTLEEMVRYLWITKDKDEAFPALKSAECVEIHVHCTLLLRQCVSELLKVGYDFDTRTGMLFMKVARP